MVGSTSYTYDSSGNTTNNGNQSFTYDAKGRLSGTTKNNIAYSYGTNGLGQRVSKTSTALSSGGRVYVYNEAGHLLGEYDTSGTTQREYLYLGGRPVAAVAAGGSAYPIISDHLGTPRQAVNSQAQTVWQWGNTDPFGNAAANTNPQGLGNFYFPLRFPGQTLDDESGLSYNYFRDYDPKLGRYAESDPVGLAGGMNTYRYVGGNPFTFIDLDGLIEGSPSNIAKRNEINIAKSYNGSTAWCKACKKDNFPSGSNKCNKYVYDVTKEAGAEARYKGRPPLAAEWASPKTNIPNWHALGKNESPMPGDVAAYKLPGGGNAYSGHTGIITDFFWGFGLNNSSAHQDEVGSSWNQFEGNSSTTYRRYTGE